MAKIVQGECRSKWETKFRVLIIPSRRLFYGKIVQGERRSKRETQFHTLIIPSRRLFYGKVVQGERRSKCCLEIKMWHGILNVLWGSGNDAMI